MPTLAAVTVKQLRAIQDQLRDAIRTTSTLDRAAQHLADQLVTAFQPSVVLARVYVSMDLGALPTFQSGYARTLAQSAGVAEQLRPETPVLALAASAGVEPAWNDRRLSKGHVAIPLASARFADSIPMIARLLSDLGIGLDWIDQRVRGIPVARLLGEQSINVFHVPDARTQLDVQGRKVIPAQDFVAKYEVRTVFGIGGAFPDGTLVAAIAFTRETLDPAAARRLAPLVSVLRASTTAMVGAGSFFARA